MVGTTRLGARHCDGTCPTDKSETVESDAKRGTHPSTGQRRLAVVDVCSHQRARPPGPQLGHSKGSRTPGRPRQRPRVFLRRREASPREVPWRAYTPRPERLRCTVMYGQFECQTAFHARNVVETILVCIFAPPAHAGGMIT